MNEEVLKTTDLYYGAYLLVKGNTLAEIKLDSHDHKKQVRFCFRGSRLLDDANEYIQGRASCNVNQLRTSIDHLKRIAYQKLNGD